MLADAFDPLRTALEGSGVRYAIGGSWASTTFGEPRFTYDVDILAQFTVDSLRRFLSNLPETFYVDAEEALAAIRSGRSFNVIHMPMAFKFDFFPASGFAIGIQELDRAVQLSDTGLSKAPVPFVTPEDLLLAKFCCFRGGGEASEVQWRDIKGITGSSRALDTTYLRHGAATLEVLDLLERALAMSERR